VYGSVTTELQTDFRRVPPCAFKDINQTSSALVTVGTSFTSRNRQKLSRRALYANHYPAKEKKKQPVVNRKAETMQLLCWI
jgi:hypothetical protein